MWWKMEVGVMFLFLMITSCMDIRKRWISCLWMIMGTMIIGTFRVCFWKNVIQHKYVFLGAFLISVLFFLFSYFTKEKFGYADSWMIFILGMHLGMWKLFYVLAIAFAVCGFTGTYLLWRKKKGLLKMNDFGLPFIPFIGLGYIGLAFW